jgi:hypothetical protein
MTASEAGQPSPATSSTVAAPSAASGAKPDPRGWAPRPALQGVLALAAYLAAFIVLYGYTLLRHPGVPQVGQAAVDPNFYVWSLRWWPYAISHGLNPLYSRQIGAPGGFGLSWTTTTPALAIVVSPVTALFGPIVALNLTLVLSAPVSAWVAFLASRRLTGRFWAALAAGTVYGFSPYEVGHTGAGQANLAVIMLLPLVVYLALLWRDGKLGDRRFVGLMALTMAAEFYVFNEAFAEMTMLGAVGLVIGFALARPEQRRTIVRLARLSAVAWIVSVVLALPYVAYALLHYSRGLVKASYPGNWLHLDGLASPWSGIVLLVIAAALAVFAWSSRLTRVLIILFVLILALAVGQKLMIGNRQLGALPWGSLWSLPLARSAEPVRLMLFGYLVLAIIVALWLAMPARSTLWLAARWILGFAAVAGILAYVPHASNGNSIPAGARAAGVRPTATVPAFISAGLYRDYVRPGEIVVVVSDRGNAGMLFQADTDFYFRIAGGFINAALTDPTALPEPVEQLMHGGPAAEQQFRRYVRQAGIGAVLVEQAWSAPWMQVFSQMGLRGTSVGGMIVYPTG